MQRLWILIYGIVAYLMFLGSFLYAIGFVENCVVPKTIDGGTASDWVTSLVVDGALLGLFAVQHSVMARPGFKRRWTRIMPEPAERSTFVVLSAAALLLLYWQWRPLPEPVWNLTSPPVRTLLWGVSALGWLVALISTFLIDHFELFGLRQVFAYFTGRAVPKTDFQAKVFYRYVRHPLMVGFLIAFWATPTMSVGHLFFAAMTTAYVLVAIQLEERDLASLHGDEYREYQRQVGMLIPRPARATGLAVATSHKSAR
jgi:protein-S-isoprenylcysteine O-methyltransferase Ste14